MGNGPKRQIELVFPHAGLDKSAAYQKQPPYTSPDCLNVRSADSLTGRRQGGVRPGYGLRFHEQLGSGSAVRMMATVPTLDSSGYTEWLDDYEGTAASSTWTAAAFGFTGTSPAIANGLASVPNTATRGLYRAMPTTFTSVIGTTWYYIGIYLVPYRATHGGTYHLCGRFSTSPLVAGIDAYITLNVSTGVYTGFFDVYTGSSRVTHAAMTGGTLNECGWFEMKLSHGTGSGNTQAVVSVKGTTIADYTGSPVTTALSATSVGWYANSGNSATGGVTPKCQVDAFRLRYTEAYPETRRRNRLVVSSGGAVYTDVAGVLTQQAASGLPTDRNLSSTVRGEVLYVADHGLQYKSTGGVIGGAANDELTDAGVADWTTLATATGFSATGSRVRITAGAGGTTNGIYNISSVAAAHLHLALATTPYTGVPGAGTCTYEIIRAPKTFTLPSTLANLVATAGPPPLGYYCVCQFLDRMYWGGPGPGWVASRQGTVTDYDTTSTTTGHAVSSDTPPAGTIGENIRALMPFADDYLLFGCTDSIWILRGDPDSGGTIDSVARDIGVLDRFAWCWGPNGTLYFMAKQGLCALPRGGGGGPKIIVEHLPRDLQNVDPDTNQITLIYDYRGDGLHLIIAPNGSRNGIHYWVDRQTGGFFPVQFRAASVTPNAAVSFTGLTSWDSGPIFGSQGGYVYEFRDRMEADETTAITNYAMFGPIHAAGTGWNRGFVRQLLCRLHSESGSVTLTAHKGQTAEEAVTASAFDTWTLGAGLNLYNRAQMGCEAFCVKLAGSGSRAWALDSLYAEIERRGKARK